MENECKGRIHTKNKKVVKEVIIHSPGPLAVNVEVAEIKTSVKRKADEAIEVLSSVVNACIENSSQTALGALPTSDAMENIVRRNQINFILLLQTFSV